MRKIKKISPGKRIILILAVITVVVLAGYSIMGYLGQYYPATATAVEAMSGNDHVSVTKTEDYYLFTAGTTSRGIIFYPGGKVEEDAYAPLACGLAEAGYDVYLMRMPFHLAVLKQDAADTVIDAAEGTEDWIMMGHSLGGSMAAGYAAKHADVVDGLVLLAAYSTADLSGSGVKVLSIYGENDKVLNRSSYEKYSKNLPEDFSEFVIEGGNHAGFGYYGAQKGDGRAGIMPREQQDVVVDQVRNAFGDET